MYYEFDSCFYLDFINFFYVKHPIELEIISIYDFNPKHLHFKNQVFQKLSYKKCTNTDICDIQNYTDLTGTIELIHYRDLYNKFKNLTHILFTNIKKVNVMYIKNNIYSQDQLGDLMYMLSFYTRPGRGSDFIMDMTVELIDRGFEDEV